METEAASLITNRRAEGEKARENSRRRIRSDSPPPLSKNRKKPWRTIFLVNIAMLKWINKLLFFSLKQ